MLEFINQNPGITVLAALLLMIIVTVIALALFSENQTKRMRRDRERMLNQLRRENDIRSRSVDRLNEAVGDSMRQVAEMAGTMDARMEEMRRMMGERLDSRLSESFRVVNSQLADVHRGIGEVRELAANVMDLKKVLGNVKTRGVWGEVLLKNLLSEMFAPDQYIENAAIPENSQQRVEFALKLPDRDGTPALLPIDSKFPQEDYLRLAEAEDPQEQERCRKLLERAVLEQAKMISEKYIRPPQTADFAVLFLPSEGLYAECARIGGLIERGQNRYRVLISGPSTLCALLTSLQMGWRTCELEKRSGEILELFDEMRGEFAHFQEGIARARQRLNQAESELDVMESRARKISKKLN